MVSISRTGNVGIPLGVKGRGTSSGHQPGQKIMGGVEAVLTCGSDHRNLWPCWRCDLGSTEVNR